MTGQVCMPSYMSALFCDELWGGGMLSSQLLKLQGADLCFCLMFEPGLCAQQGSNSSSVCILTVSLDI